MPETKGNHEGCCFSINFLNRKDAVPQYSIIEHWNLKDENKKYQNIIKLSVCDGFKVYYKKDKLYVLIYNNQKPFVSLQIFCKDRKIGEQIYEDISAKSFLDTTEGDTEKMLFNLTFIIEKEQKPRSKFKQWLWENL